MWPEDEAGVDPLESLPPLLDAFEILLDILAYFFFCNTGAWPFNDCELLSWLDDIEVFIDFLATSSSLSSSYFCFSYLAGNKN